ncbi:uncharacterized protein LOC134239676 [Saccostrea cucullata]|uniref:uncharacterized protein LOC134239676 n=1 Tax=Saccostrea cuccullata TaxID=36930 RepID=UPI002ED28C52
MGNAHSIHQTSINSNPSLECETHTKMIAEAGESDESLEVPECNDIAELLEPPELLEPSENVVAVAAKDLDFSTTVVAAQDILRCDFCCEEDVVAEMFCKTCALRLCSSCVSKHIETSSTSCLHDIARYKSNKDFMRPVCKFHLDNKCEIFCKECNSPFCSQCLSEGKHKNHDITGICGTYALLKEKILKDTAYMEENMIPEYEKNVSQMIRRIEESTKKYEETANTMCQIGIEWHKQLESAIVHHKEDIQKMKEKDLETLNQCHASLSVPLADIRGTIEENRQIINSLDFNRLFAYRSSVENFRKIPPLAEINPGHFEQHTTLLNQLDELIGKLGNSKTINIPGYTIKIHKNPTLLASFHSKYRKGVRRLRCHGEKTVWMCGFYDRLLKFVDLQGSVIQRVISRQVPVCMTITSQRDLIYLEDNSVNTIKDGECVCLFRVQDWKLRSVCSTVCNQLLIGMTNSSKTEGKVVRYSGTKLLSEIQQDSDGNILFRLPYFLVENRNLDICVTEVTLQKVVVTDKTGNLRFTYSGNSAMKNTFKPMDLASDSKSQILIADRSNNCIHIIDQDGHFVKIIDSFGLKEPFSLSVSAKDDLWVGEGSSGMVKVIRYMAE